MGLIQPELPDNPKNGAIDENNQIWNAYTKIRNALEVISESDIDTGFANGARHYWVRINGSEFFIEAKKSTRQISISEKANESNEEDLE